LAEMKAEGYSDDTYSSMMQCEEKKMESSVLLGKRKREDSPPGEKPVVKR
jgi:hypothetical protein